MNTDAKIDDWVAHVNASHREPLFDDEAPSSVVVGEPTGEDYPLWDWNIKRYSNIDWIEAMQARLPAPFPSSFRSLVSRYIFPEFDFGPLCLLANTPEKIAPLHELRSVIEHDEDLARVIIECGYLPFARPATGDFDLVCFDSNANSNAKDDEFSIVRIDHESVFIHNEIRVTETISRNFLQFIAEH